MRRSRPGWNAPFLATAAPLALLGLPIQAAAQAPAERAGPARPIHRNPPGPNHRPPVALTSAPTSAPASAPASAPPSAPPSAAEVLPEAPPGANVVRDGDICTAYFSDDGCPPDANCNPPPPMRVRCP